MAITKVGKQLESGEYLEKVSGVGAAFTLPRYLLHLLDKSYQYAKKGPTHAYRVLPKLYNTADRVAVRPFLRAANTTGKFVYKHPVVGVPLVATTLYGANRLGKEINKNILHTDPNMDVTYEAYNPILPRSVPSLPVPSPFTRIKYKNKAMKNYYDKKQILYEGV